MNVLITSAGRRVSLLRAFQKELKKIAPKAKVFAADANPKLSAACEVADDYFGVPGVQENTYISLLLDKCKTLNIKIIVPTIDTELSLLASNKAKFEAEGIFPIISSLDFVAKCRNKRVIHEFFEKHGVRVAHEYDKKNYKLPLFIKPYDGSRSVDTYLIRTEKELRDFHFTNEKLMFLEYLDHQYYEEYTCDLYYDRTHRLRCVVPRKRLEVRDGEVNKGLTVDNILVPLLRDKLGFVEGAVGCLTAQFFVHKDDESVFGIEINPRFGGGYPLSYSAGANFPAWILHEYLQNEAMEDQFNSWERNLLMMRYDDEILVHGYQS